MSNDYKRYGEPWDEMLFLAADAYDMDLPAFMEMLAAGPDLKAHPELAALVEALPDGGDAYQAEAEAEANAAAAAEAEESHAEQEPKAKQDMPHRRKLSFAELAEMLGILPPKRMPGPRREELPTAEYGMEADRQLSRPEAPVLERK